MILSSTFCSRRKFFFFSVQHYFFNYSGQLHSAVWFWMWPDKFHIYVVWRAILLQLYAWAQIYAFMWKVSLLRFWYCIRCMSLFFRLSPLFVCGTETGLWFSWSLCMFLFIFYFFIWWFEIKCYCGGYFSVLVWVEETGDKILLNYCLHVGVLPLFHQVVILMLCFTFLFPMLLIFSSLLTCYHMH